MPYDEDSGMDNVWPENVNYDDTDTWGILKVSDSPVGGFNYSKLPECFDGVFIGYIVDNTGRCFRVNEMNLSIVVIQIGCVVLVLWFFWRSSCSLCGLSLYFSDQKK